MEIQEILQYLNKTLHEINMLSTTVRMLLALVMGGILGAEREIKNHPAGFRTYVLVCIGSTLIMLTNQYILTIYPYADPTRLAAQVVSGIGFLGVGTIIITKRDEVRGLTTAAGIWFAAGLGIAIGAGFYSGAFVGFFIAVFALRTLKRLDICMKKHAKSMEIYMEFDDMFSLRSLSDYAKAQGFELLNLQRSNVRAFQKELGVLTFTLNFSDRTDHEKIIDTLYEIEGVRFLRELS